MQPKLLQDDSFAGALARLSEADMLRLKAIARLRARALPAGIGWADLLNEAVLRALDGSRRWPPGMAIVPFLGGVMRSIADEHWRRVRRESRVFAAADDGQEDAIAPADSQPDPERHLAAMQALAAIDRMFADDPSALRVLAGLAAGLSAGEIQETYGMTEIEYDSTRKRMRRTLLRRGVAWSWP